jgi:hypothetical protein
MALMLAIRRSRLYVQMWEEHRMEDLAGRYGSTEAKIRSACRALNIPIPPDGWGLLIYTERTMWWTTFWEATRFLLTP